MGPKIAIASAIYGDTTVNLTNYTHAVEAFGGRAFVLGEVHEEDLPDILDYFDALLLTGGGDIDAAYFGQENHPAVSLVPPARDSTEILLARAFCQAGKPVLGICRGEQVLNVAMGGDLIQHIPDVADGSIEHRNAETRHAVFLVGGMILRGIFPGQEILLVNSTHHQAVGQLAPGFVVSARAADGIIEAIEMDDTCLGVQWHPERMLEEGMAPLWEWFIGAASQGS